MFKKDRCIIFGGTGFIGKHVAVSLLEAGHHVSIFTRSKVQNPIEGAIYLYGDFMNASEIDAAVKGHTRVFHLVSLTNPAISDKDPFIDIDTNIKMTVHLLESCVRHKVLRVIYTSSGGAIYGSAVGESHKETDAIGPISPYAIGKATIEGYLRYFNLKHGLDYIALRISNVYGEGQDISKGNHGIIPIFISRIINGQEVTVFGDGSMMRDYVYVKDVAATITRVFNANHAYNLYNVGSGIGITVNEILNIVQSQLQLKAKVIHRDTPASFVDRVVLDCKRITEEFGDIAPTSLPDGVANTIKQDFMGKGSK